MQIKELLFGVPILFFIIWIFAAPVPQDRISRACEPINWVGNVATSTTALSAESHTATTARWSDKLDYSCQFLIWRLFYQADYNKAIAAGLIKPAPSMQSIAIYKPVEQAAPADEHNHPGNPGSLAQPLPVKQ
ncbi:TonB-dependent receptor [Novimethylophilus kurashikiensis]|uniref:TonB-dependent receptor n=1 Tax=Novimethylophilus kurashikiensis TaxID=1825523 RepID=A0A2R5F9A1_9PROT|nr:hypothetical protein [Novimethylophilus kurashikiensis]GBG14399.1 TonB-dependent receptor [Novimethylophilus kurashikiensis]